MSIHRRGYIRAFDYQSATVEGFMDFFGINTRYACVDGVERRRVYLDSAASTLMMKAPYMALHELLDNYANIHTDVHFAAREMAGRFEWAVQTILNQFGAHREEFTCLFDLSATACLNRFARLMSSRERGRVLISLMEHHSNDLPHRHNAEGYEHIRVETVSGQPGAVDLQHLEELLKRSKVKYVTLSACSNVTGILNPVEAVADLCQRYGAWLLLDGSQSAVHDHITLSDHPALAGYVFVGHKAYAPGTVGVLIVRKSLLSDLGPTELGGGAVDEVTRLDYTLKAAPFERNNPGSPNVLSVFQIAKVFECLSEGGHLAEAIARERLLTAQLYEGLQAIDGVTLYGAPPSPAHPRSAVVAFNLRGVGHKALAQGLNDRFNVALRAGCFCSHPYVRFLLRSQDARAPSEDTEYGMVRASMAMYTTRQDIDVLIDGVAEIARQSAVVGRLTNTTNGTSAEALSSVV
jgi:selenocysteine lyase/cysteine desulfurase